MEQYFEVIASAVAGLVVALIALVLHLAKKLKDETGSAAGGRCNHLVVQRLDRLETVLLKNADRLELVLDRQTEHLTDLGKLLSEMKGRLEAIRINGAYGQRDRRPE
jgi:hypothetical protein